MSKWTKYPFYMHFYSPVPSEGSRPGCASDSIPKSSLYCHHPGKTAGLHSWTPGQRVPHGQKQRDPPPLQQPLCLLESREAAVWRKCAVKKIKSDPENSKTEKTFLRKTTHGRSRGGLSLTKNPGVRGRSPLSTEIRFGDMCGETERKPCVFLLF